MFNLLACPTSEKIRQILAGELSARECEEFAEHLEQCTECADQVEGMQLYRQMIADAEQGGKLAAKYRVEESARIAQQAEQITPADDGGATLSSVEIDHVLAPALALGEMGRFGSFRVLEVLGAGGMGVVFKAEDTQLKRMVALKVMHGKLAAKPSYRDRFLREVRAVAAIEHDHIVPIYQVGEEAGVLFFAMPWLKGVSLGDWLKRQERMPIAQILYLGRQIALGLAAAHERGLVHRDIKPGNIWLELISGQWSVVSDQSTEPGGKSESPPAAPSSLTTDHCPLTTDFRVKILDFGLARPVADNTQLTQEGVLIGTPAYMAPEQPRGRGTDHRCDLFSLGVVLYQMTTGKMPFAGDNVMEILSSLALHTPANPRSLNRDVPAGLDELIIQLLTKEPEGRPATARVVAERLLALERQQAGGQSATLPTAQISAAPPVEVAQSALAPVRARRGWKPTFVLASVAAAIIGIFVAWQSSIIRIPTPEGDYVLETDAPNISFKVHKGVVTLQNEDTKISYKLKVVQPERGKFLLEVTNGDGAAFKTDMFTMKQGETIKLKAWFESKSAKADPFRKDPPRPVPIPVGASPLDKLNAKDIPPQERFDWQPKELVAVIGQHQQRYWYPDHSPFGAWSVAWSSNGKWIASCGWSEDVPILWDAQTMQELAMPNFKPEARMRETYANERVAFSPDSKTLVFSRGKKIWLLDLTKTPPTVREELNCPGFVYEFAISFDGAILAARDSSQAVHLWDLTGAKPLPPIKPRGFHRVSMAFGNKTRSFACRSVEYTEDKKSNYPIIQVWDLTDPKKPVETAAFKRENSDANYLSFGPADLALFFPDRGHNVCWWNLTAKGTREIKCLTGALGSVVQVSPASKILALSYISDGSHECRLLDLSGEPTLTAINTGPEFNFTSMAFSPDGKAMATAGRDGSVRIWDLQGGRLKERGALQGHVGRIQFLAFRGSDSQLISACGGDLSIRVWDLDPTPKQRLVHQWPTNIVSGMALAPNGKTVVLAAYHKCVSWDDVTMQQPRETPLHGDGGAWAGLCGDGKVVIAGLSGGPTLYALDPLTKCPPIDPDVPGIRRPATADGALAYFVSGQGIRVWSGVGGSAPKSQDLVNKVGEVGSIALSRNGKTMLVGGRHGLQLWRATNEKWEAFDPFSPSNDSWWVSAFSPDDRSVAAADRVGNVVMLDVRDPSKTGVPMRILKLPGMVTSLAFAKDGRHLALGNSNGTIYILRLAEK